MVCNDRFNNLRRLLKSFQYDGETLAKSGSYVLMQDDTFLRALLNSYSVSYHFTHKVASTEMMSEEERMIKEIYRSALNKYNNEKRDND